jgi:ABC-2 type transport system permease protein
VNASTTALPRARGAVPRSPLQPLATLARRRLELTARTPRELLVPLLTPILFALVIAPALRQALHTGPAYEAFVATGTIGLLIPLNTVFAGLGVLVERESGGQRDLLAAPVARALLPLANGLIAIGVTAFQVAVLLVAARARGIHFAVSAAGWLWFAAAGVLLAIVMYAVAEILAARVARAEEYVARVPAIAIVPWFLAGSLFPITALPLVMEWVARFLPLTHAMALMRYGLLGDSSGLANIWRGGDPTTMALLSLLVVGAFATLTTAVSIRVFTKAAVR